MTQSQVLSARKAVLKELDSVGSCGLKMSNEADLKVVSKLESTLHRTVRPIVQIPQNVRIAGVPSNLRIRFGGKHML